MTFLPLTYFRAAHNYTGTSWQDFTGDLASVQITLREFSGKHTGALVFYRANMDPSQTSATTVVKRGDKIRIFAKNNSGTWRRMATFLVRNVAVDIDLSQPVGRQNKVTVHLHGRGATNAHHTGSPKGVATLPELPDVIAGAAYEVNGDGYALATYAWTGTAHASTSTETDVDGTVRTNLMTNPSFETGVTPWTAGAANAIAQDATWADVGTKSLKITPSGTGSDTYAQVTFAALTPGAVYQVSATCHQTVTQTGTLDPRARAISCTTTATFSAAAPNAAGDTRVSFTFTAPGVGATLRLYNGSGVIAQPIWWDSVVMEAATTDGGGYFDGASGALTGTTTAPGTSVEAAYVNDASTFDQVILTRDSNPGTIAYEDPAGRIQVFDPGAHRVAAPKLTIGPAAYSGIDETFDMSHIINTVTFKYFEKIKPAAHHTRIVEHDVTFTDSASFAKYGPYRRVIKTHKKSNFSAHASLIFARNADPANVPASVTVPIRAAAELLPGYEDGTYVGEKVKIVLPDNVTTFTCRIARMQHILTPTTWLVQIFLRDQNVIQRPRDLGKLVSEVANTPDGAVLTAALDDGAVTSVKTAYPVIGAIAGTAPATPKVSDVWIDTSAGNAAKQWNGTTWVSIQDTAIAAAQSTANGKNKVTYSVSDPGATANTAGDLWFTYSGSIVSKQWQGNGGTSWTQVTIANTVIANLDAGKITTGFLDVANRVAADSVTADKVLIGIGHNAIANPGFETGAVAPHVVSGTSTLTAVTTTPRSGTYAGQVTVGATRLAGAYGYDFFAGGGRFDVTRQMPVAVGDVIYAEAYARNGTLTAGAGVRLYMDFFDAAGASVSQISGPAITISAAYQQMTNTQTAPAGAAYVSFGVTTAGVTTGQTFLVEDLWLSKQVTGSLLVNGAIDGKTITGAIIQTAATNGVKIENDAAAGVIKFIGTNPADTPGFINPIGTTPVNIHMSSGSTGATLTSAIKLLSAVSATPKVNSVRFETGFVDFQGAERIRFLGAGQFIKDMAMGVSTALSNASSQVVVTHGMTVTPTVVLCQGQTNNRLYRVTAISATTFTVEGTVGTTNVLIGTGANMLFMWQAWA